MLRKALIALVAATVVFGMAACNTVRGAGEDLESAADAADKEI